MKQSDIINKLNKIANTHFIESNFSFFHKKPGLYESNGNYLSNAINHYKHESFQIKVLKWFDRTWIYSTIEFNKSNSLKIQSFSLSVFWGNEIDSEKKQLFRAEWDFYDDNEVHPQPHWHFYTNKEIDYLKNTFAEIIEEEESKSFLEDLSEERSLNSFPIGKFHFAMNGKWSENLGHIQSYDDIEEFVNWFDGLLGHLRSQLLYSTE